jgi:coenzyme F420-dependent glucose-6-phosphate dehydrogenase
MPEIGYWLSSEEHAPSDLVRHAKMAEQAGFTWAMISDHYHPWIDKQGNAPFVWSTLGGIAQATERLHIGTGVTCPIIRTHPAVVAQASATVAAMMPGRFFLGVGTGENLNEHITGEHWPPYRLRAAMLEEAVDIIRLLWKGGLQSYHGLYFTLENARLYSLPPQPPSIMVAAAGPKSAALAARIGDGLVSTSPEKDVPNKFNESGGKGKPMHAQFSVCWARTEEEALNTTYEIWPTSGLKGALSQELPLPAHFEDAASLVTKEMVAKATVHGPDPEPYVSKLRQYIDAGFTHIYLHQIGPDQEGFLDFWKHKLQPALSRQLTPSGSTA